MTSLRTSLLLLAACASSRADDGFTKDVKPFLDRYCLKCHDAKTKRGGVDLSRFKTAEEAKKDAAAWAGYAARVRAHEMPPEGSRMPSIAQREAFLKWSGKLTAAKTTDCRELASDKNQNFYPGHVMSRRLTRGEYQNTLRDLFGVPFQVAANLPADGSGGGGFDTTGDSLFTSAIHAEKYLQAAEEVLRAVLDTGKAPAKALTREEKAKARKLLGLPGKTREDAARIVGAFAARAYRRPSTSAETERLLKVFDIAIKRGDAFEAALRLPLKAVLISPHFLFLVEPEGEKDGTIPLPGHALASRLSYFVWSTMPDDTLLSLAAKGELAKEDVLKAQLKRMLKDDRARGFAEGFGLQWLGLERFQD